MGDIGIMKILYRHISKDIFSKKVMTMILALLMIFTSFLFFFVHFSFDGNLRLLSKASAASLSKNQEKYLIALNSNTVLIRNMTLAMVAIFACILFLFINNIKKKIR